MRQIRKSAGKGLTYYVTSIDRIDLSDLGARDGVRFSTDDGVDAAVYSFGDYDAAMAACHALTRRSDPDASSNSVNGAYLASITWSDPSGQFTASELADRFAGER